MKEIGQWKFEVFPGEQVYMRVVARQSQARFVGVWNEDHQALKRVDEPYDYDRYFFSVSKAPGQKHMLLLECNFSQAAPDAARYDLWIGSDMGPEFLRSVNSTAGKNQDIDIEFVVANVPMAEAPPLREIPQTGPIVGDRPLPPITEPRRGKGWARAKPPLRQSIEPPVTPPPPPPPPLVEPPAEEPPQRPVGWTTTKPPLQEEAGSGASAKPSDIRPGGAGEGTFINAEEKKRPGKLADSLQQEVLADLRDKPSVTLTAACPVLLPQARRKAPKKPIGGKKSAKRTPAGRPELAPPQRAAKKNGGAARPPRKAPVAKKNIVNVGFAPQNQPDTPLKTNMPLISGQRYFFWLEVGALIKESLEAGQPTTLPTEYLPQEAVLKVVLFPFKGELEVEKNATVGELKLHEDGSATVARQPLPLEKSSISADLLERRLFFPIRTSKTGIQHLRCNIYCEQVLVQSRLITARVSRQKQKTMNALRSAVDYTLTHSIDPAHLAGLGAHQLSLMLNGNGDGTADLRFFGEKEFTGNASFDEGEMQDLITQGREALRKASWGDKNPWTEGKPYRYEQPASFDQLRKDLAMLARKGYAFYSHVIDKFTGGAKQSDDLAVLMRKPGRVQIALKESARHFIPSALIYDYPLDNGLADDDYKICPAFQKAFKSNTALEDADCFKGLCPSIEDDSAICPSGFWGFRHYLGMPLSLNNGTDATPEIAWQGSPHLTMAVATGLELREIHHTALLALKAGLNWDYTEDRDKTLALMKQATSHLVYFYCHGGLDGNEPYIRVGPGNGPRLTEAVLRSKRIQWNQPRPLVFINGCHTTALEPEQALEFVSSFVTLANAAGVIGTEITVFEPLAKAFAESFMRFFIVGNKSVGESIRSARLALLKAGNPLGLVYLPFVIGTLRMVEQQAAVQPAVAGRP